MSAAFRVPGTCHRHETCNTPSEGRAAPHTLTPANPPTARWRLRPTLPRPHAPCLDVRHHQRGGKVVVGEAEGGGVAGLGGRVHALEDGEDLVVHQGLAGGAVAGVAHEAKVARHVLNQALGAAGVAACVEGFQGAGEVSQGPAGRSIPLDSRQQQLGWLAGLAPVCDATHCNSRRPSGWPLTS